METRSEFDSNDISELLNRALLPQGFQGKNRNWFLHTDECIIVVNLQGSSFGAQFYINIGVFLLGMGNTDFPKERDCHIRTRLETIASGTDLSRALDLENTEMSATDRQRIIADALNHTAAPFIGQMKDLRSVTDAINSGKLSALAITRKAQEYLGILKK
jgi:hypothetical protein